MLYQLQDKRPQVAENVYIAPGSHIIGQVTIEEHASVWFNVVIRGDCDQITIGRKSNVQDGSVLHTDEGIPLTLGEGVTVGHKAMLHGCEVGDFSLIGINAVVLNGAKVGRHCLVGANALVTENMTIPDGSVVMGAPAKVVKSLTPEQQKMLEFGAEHYVNNAKRFSEHLSLLD